MRSLLLAATLASAAALAQDLEVRSVKADLSKDDPAAPYWASAPETNVSLIGQPMVVPRPGSTTTANLTVQAVHDGKRIAFRLRWADTEKSEAGPLGKFSDAAAIQFPAQAGDFPPPVMMGAKGLPVHLFHWRAQYQRDREQGKPDIKTLYPNGSIDIYPMEFPAAEANRGLSEKDQEKFSPARAEGNPQAYAKTGVDEIIAEGFSTSQVQEGHSSSGQGVWKDGGWTLVISRPLVIEGGSTLKPGAKSWAAFAVWQGGQGEVGSRKCLTMAWSTLVWKE
ncbi:MAG: ethylbenzene dehydrogenase-related protein [Myxococcaceae bacterium]|nr:ethylbenzene dehydrogenase-related protein [Myxococcaceae bacterium]